MKNILKGNVSFIFITAFTFASGFISGRFIGLEKTKDGPVAEIERAPAVEVRAIPETASDITGTIFYRMEIKRDGRWILFGPSMRRSYAETVMAELRKGSPQ